MVLMMLGLVEDDVGPAGRPTSIVINHVMFLVDQLVQASQGIETWSVKEVGTVSHHFASSFTTFFTVRRRFR